MEAMIEIRSIKLTQNKKHAKKRSHIMLDKYRKIGHYQERFGSFAIEKGFISQGDLSMAQAINTHEEAENGIYRHLGDILFFQGIMSANQVKK